MNHSFDYRTLKINGIYQQNATGDLMLRLKLPAGVISAVQATAVAEFAEKFADEALHLTCRGNIELHGLRGENLAQVYRGLQAVGLTSRGACGGAVRAVACNAAGGSFDRIQLLVERLHRHFTGNPYFEGLPKKFKLAVENGYSGARHLCQDLALVYLGREGERELCDLWVAGGLGRQPQEAFLLANRVPVERILPLVEGVIRVYQQHAPAGKRLKHLLAEIGEQEFRTLLGKETAGTSLLSLTSPLDDQFGAAIAPGTDGWVELPVAGGQLASNSLRCAADIAGETGDGFLAISREQNVLVSLSSGVDESALRTALQGVGLLPEESCLRCRACPGSHECPKGLVATRDLLGQLNKVLGPQARAQSWAISGCPNGCSQPQLADYGIVGTRKSTQSQESRYDLLHRDGEGFGQPLQQGLSEAELLAWLAELG